MVCVGTSGEVVCDHLSPKHLLDNTEGDIAEAVERDKLRQWIEREIAVLEKIILREKQFNKQVELNGELKRLLAELEGLG